MPDDAQEMAFPLSGVDVSCEVDRQTPRTTPRGVNVRACDPGSLRWRGAARSGLTKLIDATVSGGVGFPVQHLNAIVDPTIEALLANFPDVMSPPGNSIPDPSTNNAAGGSTDPDDPLVRNPDREIRDGGSGIQPNRKLPPAQPIQFVQVKTGATLNVDPMTLDVVFDAAVAAGRLLVVAVWQMANDAGDFGQAAAVTNGAGSAYTQIGSYVTATGGASEPIEGTSKSFQFDSNTTSNNLLTNVVCVGGVGTVSWQDDIGAGPDFSAGGTGFSLAAAEAAAVARYGPPGSGTYYSNFTTNTFGGCVSFGPSQQRLSLWYKVASGVTADRTVTTTMGGTTLLRQLRVVGAEYRNNHATPLTAQAAETSLAATTAPTAGSVALNGSTGQAVVAVFLTQYAFATGNAWTAGTGYTARAGSPDAFYVFEDRTGLSGGGSQTPGATLTSSVLNAGICAAFKKA